MVSFLNDTLYVLGTLFTNTSKLFSEKPVYNEDFLDRLSKEDKDALDKAVLSKEIKKDVPHKVRLSNDKEITIVVR